MAPTFSPSAEDSAWVVRICRLVEGIPLAIELAAAWVRMLSCREIAQEIERNLDFLTTSLRNVPERHRSLRAVFDHSWQLLPEAERRVFSRLAVFRGGFEREAAAQVAGASLPLLLTLVDKSLLRKTQAERYLGHTLLWQYAAEKLDERPEEKERAEDRHSAYYTAFLHAQEARLQGGPQKEALAEIRSEIENVRAAWNWAVAHGKTASLEQALDSLFHFYDMRSWFQEGATAFGQAVEQLGAAERNAASPAQQTELNVLLGKLLARQGWFAFQLGQHERSEALLHESLARLRRAETDSGVRPHLVFTLNYLGALYCHLGGDEYTRARQHLQESLAICQKIDDPAGLSIALNILGQIAYLQGAYPQARYFCEESLTVKRRIGDRWGMAYSLNYLGQVAYALAEYPEAQRLFNESLAIRQEIGDRRGIALSTNYLGDVARALADYEEAWRLYQDSVAIFREIGNQWGIAFSLSRLGDVAHAREDYQSGDRYLAEALKLAMDIQAVPLALDVLVGLVALRTEAGGIGPGRALAILALVLNHPASARDTQNRAAGLLAELSPQLPDQMASQAQAETLEMVAAEVLRDVVN